MFDWFWDFLYLITKSIFRLIDGLIDSSMYLGGIKTVNIDGDDTDLLSWIFSRQEIKTGFSVACIVGIVLIVFFSIWQMLKMIVSEKMQTTPSHIAMKAFTSILTFLLVPSIMVVLIAAMNVLGKVMYDGTLGGANVTLGQYLALSFGRDAAYDEVTFSNLLTGSIAVNYKNTSDMKNYFSLSDYDYFFSWVAGIAILFTLAKALFIFVDRMFSITILYVISPFAIASSIVDEGQRFKSWRDQILIKFLTGYATLVGINIFSVIISNLCTADITFFEDNAFLDFVLKIVIVIGGTISLNRVIALVGNIIQNGAGEAELRNADQMAQGFKGVMDKTFGAAASLATGAASLGGGLKGMLAKKAGEKAGGNKKDGNKSGGLTGSTANMVPNKSPTAGNEQKSQNDDNSKQGQAVQSALSGDKDTKKQDDSNKNNNMKTDPKNDAVNKVMTNNSVLDKTKEEKGGNKK